MTKAKNILLIVAAIIIFILVYKGCRESKQSTEAYKQIETALKNVLNQDKHVREVARNLQHENLQLDSIVADLIADRDMLQGALVDESDKTKRLSAEVKKAKANRDTISYYLHCDSLAEESNKKDEYLKEAWFQVAKIDGIRQEQIENLEKQRDLWKLSYDSCLNAVKRVDDLLPALKPKGRLYGVVSGVVDGGILGVGGGFTWQSKNNILISAKALATNVGPLYIAEFGVPLSLKRK